ncbi:TPR repeat containing protein [Salpingoeca rosetta]|uniref:TPR repeat containing protein n=1 Tax=Salpingoeca rosetta (strain ATCC 50818 / BSB-021) TaxID=946362 RepID=F2UP95_SALR5|nr:TPR repeat containing protein [Salpingoeca rosetta]EGD79450.1 TPR repeat containing protein [Salpingoeca rosetta]|eukprot:XP_004988931.1 TPR repeat containing protein [Salpingoeca rosetta]
MADTSEHRLTDGVSVGAIRAFLADLKKEFPDTYTKMTTEDACKQLVVPRTQQDNCAYVDLLRKQSPHEHVGKATVFVSHAWRYKIADVLNVLLEFAEEQRVRKEDSQPVFFWFDLFMNNQNANVTANLPQEWWSTTFKESIANIGRVLLVLMPWRDPVPLTRAWCLWEIFCGVSNEGTEVSIRLPKSEESELEAAIRESSKSVMDTLVLVQAQRAEAFNPRDKDMIFEAIQNGVGFGALNQAVKDQLRAWCLSKMVAAVEAMRARGEDETRAFAELCNQVGLVLDDFGEHDGAIAYYETALPILLRTEGENGENVAALYNNLGTAYSSKGEYDLATQYYEQDLAITVGVLGEKHPNTGMTYNNLGSAYSSKGDYDRAIECFQKALAITAETLGEKHQSTADTYNNLGGAYRCMGEYDMAIPFYEKALAIKVEKLGEKHPSTAASYGNLGLAYADKGEYDRAISYHGLAKEVFVETLGEKHPHTADSCNNLGVAYKNEGKYDEAIEHYEKALAIRTEALGENHPSTATSYFNLGLLHDECGNKEQAHACVQQALGVFEAMLGPDHPNTRKVARNLRRIRGDSDSGDSEHDDGDAQQEDTGSDQVQALASQQDEADEADERQGCSSQQPLVGWLQKRGRRRAAFRPCWCKLDDSHFAYGKSAARPPKRRISLLDVLSAELAQDNSELHVAVPKRTFIFRSDDRSDTTLAEWCRAINNCLNE